MKTHTIVKNNITVYFRIGKDDAEMKTQVGDAKPTSIRAMTPIEATNELNRLLRSGYANKNAQKGGADAPAQKS